MRKRAAVLLVLAACGTKTAGGGAGDANGGRDGTPAAPDAFAGPWSDFPSAPILDGSAPADAATLFGDPTTGAPAGGPCLQEPEPGTLFPRNWLRPRFSWVATGTENLFELRLTTPHETHPLVVYTTNNPWTMPADLWTNLAAHVIDSDITMTVRGLTYDATAGTVTSGPEAGTSGPMRIAPAEAQGAIVYWTTSNATKLRGFHIGDETVADLVQPSDNGATTKCVGCHASTPDGAYVGFSASTQAGNGDPAMLGVLSADGQHTPLPFLTPAAQNLMARPYQESPVFSKHHWIDGDRVAVTMFAPTGGDQSEITWTDLQAASEAQGAGWGIVARTGDGAKWAASASFAHTDDTILYARASSTHAGITITDGDLATVPFANRAGGATATIAGADTADYNEYYPTWSPDDKYVAFNRVPTGQSSYNNPQAEVWVIPRTGGTPTKLAANTPSACTGATSPGVTNSWPKWAPSATTDGARTYYWLTFSSTRAYGRPQLYVTPVVDDGAGTLVTYPALYLWNQPSTEANHTPAWDNFAILN